MKTVGVIPARWGSTRFPGKSLALIGGKPLIQWVWEQSRKSRRLDEVVVATDDARIRSAVEAFGGRVAMTANDHPSGTDRVAEAARASPAELVVNIQGDEPLIDPGLIDALVDVMVQETAWDMATAASPLAAGDVSTPSICKVVMTRDGRALYFSRSVIPFVRDASFVDRDRLYWRHIGIYIYRRPFLDRLVATPPCRLEKAECLEQLRALDLGASIKVLETDHVGVGVDRLEDVALVERMIQKQ